MYEVLCPVFLPTTDISFEVSIVPEILFLRQCDQRLNIGTLILIDTIVKNVNHSLVVYYHLCYYISVVRAHDGSSMAEDYLTICCDTFIQNLYQPRALQTSDVGYCRIIIAALRGITHIASVQKNFFKEKLGEVLGAIKVGS